MTWGFLLVLLGFLDSRSQEGPIGISKEAQVGYGFQHLSLQKGGRESSNIKQTKWVYKLRSILNFEVLEGSEGNSFYGSRFGGTTVLDLWYLRFNEVEVLRTEG